MTTTDLAVRESQTVRLSTDQLRYIAQTEFVPKQMRGKLDSILACVATGRELGIGDMVALKSIHVIDGRASLSAELMVQLVRRRGHSIQGNFSGDSCTVVGKRADNGDEMSVTWTTEMAQNAGLLNKDNWKKYRPAMLWARAVSQLCRMLFSDCFAGGTYTEEEVADADLLADDADFQEIAQVSVEGPRSEASTSDPQFVAASQADGDDGSSSASAAHESGAGTPAGQPPSTEEPRPSAAQLKKLNVLVGQLRDAGKITTEQLWLACHREPVASEDGELHWSPLRDSLTKDEASALIERLQKFSDNVLGAAA